MTFDVNVQEILERRVEIEANSKEEAEEKFWEMYRNEEVVLDWSDHVSTDVTQVTIVEEE